MNLQKIGGECDFITTLNIAILALKHRQNKNQRQRIIMFVGSPLKHSEEELLAIGKKLKRNSIAVNIISYGSVDVNKGKLEKFVEMVNNNNNSSMVSVEPGFVIVDALFSSSLMGGDQPDQVMEDNIGGGGGSSGQPTGNIMPQSQFDKDMQKAFELSNEEENKRKASEKGPDNTGPENDKVMTDGKVEGDEDELTEEQLLKMAMDMSKSEHTKQTDDVKRKEGNLSY
jgi:26S proteasome regulatory subunit N10